MTGKRLIGIRLQFLLLVVLLMWMIVGINVYLSAESQRDSTLQERKLRGLAVLRSWAALSKERLVTGDQSVELSMYDFMDDLMKNEKGVVEVYLQDETGKVILANDPKRNGTTSIDSVFGRLLYAEKSGYFAKLLNGKECFEFYAPINLEKKHFGVARIVFSSDGIEEGIHEAIMDQLLATGLVVGIGLLFTVFLVLKITGPVKLLTSGVKEFGKRFDPSHPETADYQIHFKARNELGDVRDAFNEMTQTLKRSLEDRVRLREEKQLLKQQATTDGLTGLYNKRQFQEDYPTLLLHARETSEVLTIMMLDMDKFKVLNDTVGHKAGDKALQDLATSIHARTRDTDRSYRVGGDEFVIVLAGSSQMIAKQQSERIAAEYDRIKAPENMTGISFGIVEYNGTDTPEEYFQKADEEMYRIKKEKKAAR